MSIQDRTGTKYEKLLAYSLEALGFVRNTNAPLNYQQPLKSADIIISGTYIQPDLVLRRGETVEAVLYSTHWSNTRDSKRKFWRTWEEQAQQRVAIDDRFLAVNCVFEALPPGTKPFLSLIADQLPLDQSRDGVRPIQLEGWDPGIGWAMVESFDVTVLFPKGYPPISDVIQFNTGDHDPVTTGLLRKALMCRPKEYFGTQWGELIKIRNRARKLQRGVPETRTRYRIGLLHVFLLHRLFSLRSGHDMPLKQLIERLTEIGQSETDLRSLRRTPPFDLFSEGELEELLVALGRVYVRKGSKPAFFCKIRKFSEGTKTLKKISFNDDLKICLLDLRSHLTRVGFIKGVTNAFTRFEGAFGVREAIEDLAQPSLVERKVIFCEKELKPIVADSLSLGKRLRELAYPDSRKSVSLQRQNWHLEILLYLCGLNSAEDVQTRFKTHFERTGHKLRPHAPYGGHAQTVAFMLQGRDICEQWSPAARTRTLTEEECRNLAWECMAKSISEAVKDRAGASFRTVEEAVILYLQNKSMRIISSDLNGFSIIIEYFLGDLFYLSFFDADEAEEGATDALRNRILASWQTDVMSRLWRASPLETWVEGVSKNGSWLVKVQSSQDGNEGHKTKELSGRCRAFHLEWLSGEPPTNRKLWRFRERKMAKVALVIDGDWDRTKKKNLCEAGWDWVGDVSQLEELRTLVIGK
jgi:hypothetical protein